MIARNRAYFDDFDPFGDFDLLFGASKLIRRIFEHPLGEPDIRGVPIDAPERTRRHSLMIKKKGFLRRLYLIMGTAS